MFFFQSTFLKQNEEKKLRTKRNKLPQRKKKQNNKQKQKQKQTNKNTSDHHFKKNIINKVSRNNNYHRSRINLSRLINVN